MLGKSLSCSYDSNSQKKIPPPVCYYYDINEQKWQDILSIELVTPGGQPALKYQNKNVESKSKIKKIVHHDYIASYSKAVPSNLCEGNEK